MLGVRPGKRHQALLHQGLPARDRFAAGTAEVGVGDRAGCHGDQRSKRIIEQPDAREAERLVYQIEREERYQADKGNEAPALRLDALGELLQPAAGCCHNPIRCEVARSQERQRRTDGGAEKSIGLPPYRTEQSAAGKAEDRSGHEKDGRQREQADIGEWRSGAHVANCRLDGGDVEPLPVTDRPGGRHREQKRQVEAR